MLHINRFFFVLCVDSQIIQFNLFRFYTSLFKQFNGVIMVTIIFCVKYCFNPALDKLFTALQARKMRNIDIRIFSRNTKLCTLKQSIRLCMYGSDAMSINELASFINTMDTY